MIRLAKENDIKNVLEYIGKEYYKCLYLYQDLNKYGIDSEYAKLYIQEESSIYKSVALKYHSALHIYSKKCDFDATEIADFVKEVRPTIICAEMEIVTALKDQLSSLSYISEFGHIGEMKNPKTITYNQHIERATLRDIDSIAELLYEDDDIGASYSLEDLKNQIRERLTSGFARSYVIKKDGKVICHAGTGAEIAGVATFAYLITEKDHRGHGLASQIVNYTCEELLKDGYKIYSVYYPENSRRLHHKLGFEDVCDFGKLYLNQH